MLHAWHASLDVVKISEAFFFWLEIFWLTLVCNGETEEKLVCRLLMLTNQKSAHDTCVCTQSMDGRLPMRLWDWATACRRCLWMWRSGELSVCSPQGARLGDGLNAEQASETQTHLNTSNTDGWTAPRVLLTTLQAVMSMMWYSAHHTTYTTTTPPQSWMLLTLSFWNRLEMCVQG